MAGNKNGSGDLAQLCPALKGSMDMGKDGHRCPFRVCADCAGAGQAGDPALSFLNVPSVAFSYWPRPLPRRQTCP